MFRVDHSRRHDRYWRVTMVCITGHTPSAFLAVSTRWSAHVADPFKTEHGGGPCRPEYPPMTASSAVTQPDEMMTRIGHGIELSPGRPPRPNPTATHLIGPNTVEPIHPPPDRPASAGPVSVGEPAADD